MTAGSVLLIEDSSEVRDFLREILARDGYEVKLADDGNRAWQIINSETFDLIISDLDLPGMNGEELFARMRERSIDTPVLFTSGVSMIKEKINMDGFSGCRILTKPFEIKEIEKAISDLMGEKL